MAVLDIARSLRWHDPGRFNGYVLSQHVAGTPVDAVNLRDALPVVKEISSWYVFSVDCSAASNDSCWGSADELHGKPDHAGSRTARGVRRNGVLWS